MKYRFFPLTSPLTSRLRCASTNRRRPERYSIRSRGIRSLRTVCGFPAGSVGRESDSEVRLRIGMRFFPVEGAAFSGRNRRDYRPALRTRWRIIGIAGYVTGSASIRCPSGAAAAAGTQKAPERAARTFRGLHRRSGSLFRAVEEAGQDAVVFFGFFGNLPIRGDIDMDEILFFNISLYSSSAFARSRSAVVAGR